MKKIILFLFASLSVISSFAQNDNTIHGYISDAKSGEALPGSTVINARTHKAVSSNNYGYYSISDVNIGDTLAVQFIGYRTAIVVKEKLSRVDVKLYPIDHSIAEVTVLSKSVFKTELAAPRMSHHHLTTKDISHSFSIFGSADALKSLQLLPGVNASADGGTNLSVRGGSFDQNMILLDEAPIYNPAHSMGLFSAMNTDAVSYMDFYKGAAPAKYGGKLSSVIDMRMKEGNNQEFHANGSIGIIESRLLFEGPIVKNKSSFMLSARHGYGDGIIKFLDFIDYENGHAKDILRFSDYCAKANWILDEKNKLFVSGYYSKDRFKCTIISQDNNQQWGNATGTVRWNHIYDDNNFANLTATFSRYNYLQRQDEDIRRFDWKSAMSEFALKYDIDRYTSSNHHLTYGAKFEYHNFQPGELAPRGNSAMIPVKFKSKNLAVLGAYLGDELSLDNGVNLNMGLHATIASTIGNNGKTYVCAEPRIAASYKLTDNISLKGSYAHTVQYQHLMNNSALGLPTDIWAPSDDRIKPQQADAVSLGIHSVVPEGSIFAGTELSLEGYAKLMHSIIDFKDGTNFTMNEHLEDNLLAGRGRAAGLEAMIKKSGKRYSFQTSYTLSSAQRKINGVNKGNWYYAVYDQRHNVVVNGQFVINKKWTASANFQYHTGGRTTMPITLFYAYGTILKVFTERNGYRMPDYHRLDLSMTYNFRGNEGRRFKHQLEFAIYNVYGRKNAYSMFVRGNRQDFTQFQGYKLFLYSTVPSVTWKFTF
ncbi:MAG: TonB-dependent receptor plug domain-containing protein [Bacteroidia bacterium]|nr:TonB-dependent receptor plug domain-containing protein [Bacteroidia bacterium]